MSQTSRPSAPAKQDRWGQFRGLRWWQQVLVVAPLALIPLGGLIGGATGAVAMMINLSIAQRPFHALLKAVVMLVMVGGALVAYVAVAAAVSGLIAS